MALSSCTTWRRMVDQQGVLLASEDWDSYLGDSPVTSFPSGLWLPPQLAQNCLVWGQHMGAPVDRWALLQRIMDGQSFSSKVKDIEKFWEDSTGLHRHGHLAVLFSNLFGLGRLQLLTATSGRALQTYPILCKAAALSASQSSNSTLPLRLRIKLVGCKWC